MGVAGTGPVQSGPIRSNTAGFGEYLLCARPQAVHLMCIEPFCLHTREVKVDMSSLWESPLCRSDPGILTSQLKPCQRSAQARTWDSSSGGKGEQSVSPPLYSPVYTQGYGAKSSSVCENRVNMTFVFLFF